MPDTQGAPRPALGSLDEARRSLDLIEGTLKAYASKQWWEDHGFDLVDNVRRGLKTREVQEGFAEDDSRSQRRRFEDWWDDPENADAGVVAATAWAAWQAALREG